MSEPTNAEPIGVTTTQSDNGETNQRLLSREVKTDFRRVESASRKIRTTLQSPEGKRLFLRFFDGASLNMHFITVIAPINLPSAEIESAVAALEELVEKNTALLNDALVHAEQLCHRNGITDLATYDIAPLIVDARVHSRFGRRYLELICKVDQLMQILETLVIDEVMPNGEMAVRKAKAKRAVRSIGSAMRQTRFGLHKRINAQQLKQGAAETVDQQDAAQTDSEQLSSEVVTEVSADAPQAEVEGARQLEAVAEK
ncbi:AcaB family transcriptional regulator [Massilia sp. YMA4]|uniref:AcaB family transcriptional regulator n=1 Tax=[Empedobacter] haloabium TaxID=592317 RepID=A0ABZ1USW8_9BURK|nr:AcaB family transcriptional regulator [Massilia sp. YMA4]